jgi:alkaline phosphatase
MTSSADNEVTDSAAAATAIATGRKVNNGVLSIALPGDGSPLETLLEHYARSGKVTGLVTTTTITHATPAAFGAHEASRNNTDSIAQDLLVDSRPTLLFGGGGAGMTQVEAAAAGYRVLVNREQMMALTPADLPVSGQFGETYLPFELDGLGDLPHLSEMTRMALTLLEPAPHGFFLMVEGGRIDHAGHSNDIERLVREVSELSAAVSVASAWAAGHTDTLIIVTADHETGGMQVVSSHGKGNAPEVAWSTIGHTARNAPLYAIGPGERLFGAFNDNTAIHDLLTSSQSPPEAVEIHHLLDNS